MIPGNFFFPVLLRNRILRSPPQTPMSVFLIGLPQLSPQRLFLAPLGDDRYLIVLQQSRGEKSKPWEPVVCPSLGPKTTFFFSALASFSRSVGPLLPSLSPGPRRALSSSLFLPPPPPPNTHKESAFATAAASFSSNSSSCDPSLEALKGAGGPPRSLTPTLSGGEFFFFFF